MEEILLEMSGINKSFFGVQVLNNAQIQVRSGEVHVLLGENGAGKSTLIKILSGAYQKESGKIILDGEELNACSPKQMIEKGVSVIYQEFNLNPYVPIYENIMLGKEIGKYGIINHKSSIQEAQKYLDLIGLEVDPRTLVGELSVAQKQMVEIAKAISTDVKLLVLDEPTASITEKETLKLFEIVRNLKKKGIGIIYISHRMSELFEIGDRCTVMRDGQYVKTLDLDKTNVDELTKLMVGREVSFERFKNSYIVEDEVVLEVNNIVYKNVLKDISFKLKKGEILGLAGLVGAGRTELAKCIIGAYKKSNGTVYLKGKKLKDKDIKDSIDKGIVYLSEDRKDEGLVQIHPLTDNIALPNHEKLCKFVLNNKKVCTVTKEYINKLKIKSSSHMAEAKSLSGGNQQKVVIAKWLYSNADIYIFDEPTRGIDVGARDEIYNIMVDLVKNGASIIMISSDMVEVQKMCNRIIVLKEGRVTADLENTDELTQDQILYYALSGGGQIE
ncbi:sugar ABC transporter ATP-binding protein [Acetivibrio mesophilus]|uniref:Sugar ABC transporter ATP-binding protein n=1 Tax=Acetivibrio mesophilus TaxID=2487273 RepID=A0A4Q0I522_9FIRM|nr:sugar ABC transporter ATP-binding protein [Acetivibrio mesophilus]RXE59396.1 sugar ABC transporter ATP-binding protein [Acetivibrio mesophilus]